MVLNEALDLSTPDKAIEAIRSGNIGERVPEELKQYAYTDAFIEDINNYLKNAESMRADKTRTIQMAVKVAAHADDITEHFHLWSTRELCQNLAKYSQSDWLKQNELYKSLNIKGTLFTRHQYEELRGFMRSESLKHGKNTKGSGKKSDVELLYKDDNWILLTPKSWDAEKKIAYFTNAAGEKEKCHWCTASGDDISWYNKYTYSNTKPLYVMINKDDQAWQLAYHPHQNRVEFLNEYDRSDDFTSGGWMSSMPVEMQEKIINYFNGKSLADYTRYLKENHADEFKVKFLPYIEISGTHSKQEFNKFMIEDANIIDSSLDLYVRIKTAPNQKTRFTISESGPQFPDGFGILNKLEKKVIQLAVFQYTAETLELDIDYTGKFNEALNALKASIK
jgi:hypothetical protein